MAVIQVLVRSDKIRACNKSVADLSGGRLSNPLMCERSNTKKLGDADLSTVLMDSRIYKSTSPVLFDILFCISLRVVARIRLIRTRDLNAARDRENCPITQCMYIFRWWEKVKMP